MELKQGALVQYTNKNNQQIIWMITNQPNTGVVIHSDFLINIGTLNDLTDYELQSFVGNINLKSTA